MHASEGCVSRVWYSPCDAYRYGLSRVWDKRLPSVLFVMLNPSTADEHRNDPTVARCEIRARRMGYGAMMVANIFAFRATKPADLKLAEDPVGADNDAVLRSWVDAADLTVAAWGAHGAHRDRATEVARSLPENACHLGLTKHGHPRHPLYVSFETNPTVWPRETRSPE
ncbi:DUF1643 domain-containing protein [Marivita hallyeonensis]|uniref:DUF1643 domain-containing protein n=1 Tax=Marivita hallyeonensis TaxID=996342 RepID=A0A1M5TEB2_9RHOB|nr:DUF1643 domain-containing protein [Marivita hallyeonensis]SHH48970.1 hypothetical protein SAMN05443551_2192 [Marivita hallyeonensis]